MTRKKPESVHVFTARMDKHDYEAVRAVAFFMRLSVNEFVVQAIRDYLARHATDAELDALVERRRERMRTTIAQMGED